MAGNLDLGPMTVVTLDKRQTDPVAGGFYTVSEAARLLNIQNTGRITGWLTGYKRSNAGPIIARQYKPISKIQEVGFWDLLEIRFVDHFRAQGVSLQTLRKAAEFARQELNQHHPFATSNVKFMTDRKEVFLKTAKELKDNTLLNLVTKQYEMYVILENVLARGIEFDPASGLAERWQPKPKEFPSIYLDPVFAYGQPIVKPAGVPTDAIFQAWKAENGSYEAVSDWFELDRKLVQEAVEFELGLPS